MVRADLGDGYPALSDTGGLVVLGGPMGVHDVVDYPWLLAERELLVEAVEEGIPVLGVCLGAQQLALALGAEVTTGQVGRDRCRLGRAHRAGTARSRARAGVRRLGQLRHSLRALAPGHVCPARRAPPTWRPRRATPTRHSGSASGSTGSSSTWKWTAPWPIRGRRSSPPAPRSTRAAWSRRRRWVDGSCAGSSRSALGSRRWREVPT